MDVRGLGGRLAAGIVTVLLLATGAHAYSREAIEDARSLARVTMNQFQLGTASRADVALAQYNVLTMEYRARLITRADYCGPAQAYLQTISAQFDTSHFAATPWPTTPIHDDDTHLRSIKIDWPEFER